MRAIILAAGVGNRLSPAFSGPKCLLEIGGQSLLARHLQMLTLGGVENLTLVVGHNPAPIVEAAGRMNTMRTLVHFNPLYRLGSIISLWCARQTLKCGEDVIVMDADVLYHPEIMERLLNAPSGNYFMLDQAFIDGDEPVKICLRENAIVEFRKQLPQGLNFDRIGESVGFFRFTPDAANYLSEQASRYVADGRADLPHEELLREFALESPYQSDIIDVSGLPWIEIDFPEDVERANEDVLMRINADTGNAGHAHTSL